MTHLSKSTFNAHKLMLQPYEYMSQTGMNKSFILSRLYTAFNFWFDCPKEKVREIGQVLKKLYHACYLWDDIEDGSIIRKGLPAGYLVFGKAHTMFSAIYTCVELENFDYFAERKEEAFGAYVDAALEILQNCGMVIYHKNSYICPTFEGYEKYLCAGSWLAFAVKLLSLYGQKNSSLLSKDLEEKIGVFIQAGNDYVAIQSPKYGEMKSWCEDLTDGKFSFMVIHAIQSHPEDDRILDLMKARTSDVDEKKRFVNILNEFGAIEFTKDSLRQLKIDILEAAERNYQTKNPYLEKMIDDVLGGLETDADFYGEVPE